MAIRIDDTPVVFVEKQIEKTYTSWTYPRYIIEHQARVARHVYKLKTGNIVPQLEACGDPEIKNINLGDTYCHTGVAPLLVVSKNNGTVKRTIYLMSSNNDVVRNLDAAKALGLIHMQRQSLDDWFEDKTVKSIIFSRYEGEQPWLTAFAYELLTPWQEIKKVKASGMSIKDAAKHFCCFERRLEPYFYEKVVA